MSGTYWTDRLTMGSLELTLNTRKTNYATLDAALNAPAPLSMKERVRRRFGKSSEGTA